MPRREQLLDALRPIIRMLPMKRHGLITKLGAGPGDDAAWTSPARRYRVFRDRSVGLWYIADLASWACRWHYYAGVYADSLQPKLAKRFLGDGGTYVDIGANRGIHTTAVARILGQRGTVLAFEPNPACFRIAQAHVAMNGLQNVQLHNVALGDEEGTARLAGSGEHTGTFTLRPTEIAERSVAVGVTRGDALLQLSSLKGPILVKIDTEGYEHRVLRGMSGLLSHDRIAFSVEITDEWLRQLGSSAQSIFDEMQAAGFRAFLLKTEGNFYRSTLALQPIDSPVQDWQYDVLFAKPAFMA